MMNSSNYGRDGAQLYSSLEIAGTSYEAGFVEISRMLGDLRGKKCLDFGCGTGRSSRLLHGLGSTEVEGVDRDESMIAAAQQHEGIRFQKIETMIPFDDEEFDVILASHVFMEFKSADELLNAHAEIQRCLKPDGIFLAITMNPDSLGAQWLTFGYEPNPGVKSGDQVTCTVETPEGQLLIEDTWWSQADYEQILDDAGFVIIQKTLPLASGKGWKDETSIAPDVVYLLHKRPNWRPPFAMSTTD